MSLSFNDQIDLEWQSEEAPPDVFRLTGGVSSEVCLELFLTDLYHRWKRDLDVPLGRYIEQLRSYEQPGELIYELLVEEFGYRENKNRPLPWKQIRDEFSVEQSIVARLKTEFAEDERTIARTPSSTDKRDSIDNGDLSRIGRYRIQRELGRGAFGRVLLAVDEELHREVAVKIPYADHIQQVGSREFLREARIVAALDHPSIVPVYDVGETNEGVCYVVSKFIRGGSLADRLGERFSLARSAKLIASCARALHHAHKEGVIHRDIKPANLLLDEQDQPWITDFGLALGEHDHHTSKCYVGTPAWMSPEQARGEGHRVDARCDIYSLGVVFYELLTGRRPFEASSSSQLLKRIGHEEVRPPRQFSDSIPRQLDRICLRALARRTSDRYSTAIDFADDLEVAINDLESAVRSDSVRGDGGESPTVSAIAGESLSTKDSTSDSGSATVVPRGLRSFRTEDAHFFHSLLPGPKSVDGTPDSICFWISRLESRDIDKAFSVGLLYGPSGAGKSSLLRAGVLPRLDASVDCVLVECSRDQTIGSLRRRLAELNRDSLNPSKADGHGIVELFRQLRRKRQTNKTVVVLDQFEQWLSGWNHEAGSELVEALRQCDGVNLQCVLLVRDDFWMATTRLMRELDIPLVEGKNSAGVDLFSKKHARKVLRKFGVAYGTLQPDPTAENADFIKQSVDALAEDGCVVPVRLALFADMLKSREWNPATLKQIGGVQGVGVQFLDETFGERAPPQHRLHAAAARKLLNSLLPESGDNIKGVARRSSDLQACAGYANRDHDFVELLRILNQELRLISLVDEEGQDEAFQLTHDYLVPSLRAWLTHHERSTRRGRAKIQLRERAADWKAKPETRRLPSLLEFGSTLVSTSKGDWTETETDMMRAAGWLHFGRTVIGLLGLAILLFAGYELNGRRRADELLQRLQAARITEVPDIVREAEPYRKWLDPLLVGDPSGGMTLPEEEVQRRRTLMDLALLPSQPGRATKLVDPLVQSTGDDFRILLHGLKAVDADIASQLWRIVEHVGHDDASSRSTQLRAACGLALLDTETDRWQTASTKIVDRLVQAKPAELGYCIEGLKPVAHQLQGALYEVYRRNRNQTAGLVAAEVVDHFYAGDPAILLDLAVQSSPEQLAVLRHSLLSHDGIQRSIRERFRIASDAGNSSRLHVDKVGLLMSLGDSALMEKQLVASEDNSLRSLLITRYGRGGGRPEPLIALLDSTDDVDVTSGLLQTLGEIPEENFSASLKQSFTEELLKLYKSHPDTSVHSSAEWLLRRWGQTEAMSQIDKTLRTGNLIGERNWYLTGEGHTMARFFPVSYPITLTGKTVALPVEFAISTKETTDAQFKRFLADTGLDRPKANFFTTPETGPAIQLTWFRAAHYCNWLSEQEGIPRDQWVYAPNEEGEYEHGMRVLANSLERTGYQIPAPAFWQYAAQGRAMTTRHFGRFGGLLREYAWSLDVVANRAQSVGLLKPNELGLFDTLGNASEWIAPAADLGMPPSEETKVFESTTDQVAMKGGSFRQVGRYQKHRGKNEQPAGKTTLATTVRIMRVLPSKNTNH